MFLNKAKKKHQRTQRVRAKNRRKNRQRRGPGGSRKIGLPAGESKKQQERSDQKKAAQTIVSRENAERIRCPKRQQKMNKKRTHRIGFKFSSFCLKTPPLDFRHEKEKRLAKIPFYFFRGLVWGSRCEKWSKKRTEKQTKTRSTSKAWKIRPLKPYSVERGGGHPHYKYSVKHVSLPKM